MRAQRGQAIVIVALVLLGLLGIVALGIDAGRGFADRRQVQAASDAAALAAASDYHLHGDAAGAAVHGSTFFGANVGVASFSAAPAATCPGVSDDGATVFTAAAYTVCIGWRHLSPTDPTQMQFHVVADHLLPVAMMQALGAGPNMRIAADASAVTGYASAQAAMIALKSGCGPKDAITFGGNSTVTVDGAVISNGSIDVNGSGTPHINGDVSAVCTPAPDGLAVTGTVTVPGAPAPDPNYPVPTGYGTGPNQAIGTGVDVKPGVYSSFQVSGDSCYFAWPGVYTLNGGFKNTGAIVSNALRAPGEANPNDITKFAPTALWNVYGADCAGLVRLAAASVPSARKLPAGDWAVRVTAVRQDNNATRESAASRVSGGETETDETKATCTPVKLDAGSSSGLQVWIDNVPGATSYNIYLAKGGCSSGAFGYVGSVTQNVAEVNGGNCPEIPNAGPAGTGGWQAPKAAKCNLGFQISKVYDSTDWTNPTGARCTTIGLPSAPASKGCAPPAEEIVDPIGGAAAPPAAADSATAADLTGGDRANENLCVSSSGTPVVCTRDAQIVTPGGVAWVLADRTCFDQGGSSGTYIFGGQQYRWIVLYQLGTCASETFNGSAALKIIGTVYMPGGDVTMNGSLDAPIVGALIANTIDLSGASGVAVVMDTDRMPEPPPPRLVT